MNRHNHPHHTGFALPATLSLLAGVTLLAVGAFSLARVDLATSHAYADASHADHTLSSAFHHASSALLTHLQTDQFIVAKSTAPDGTTGYYTALHAPEGGWELVPLFSGATPLGRDGSPRLPSLEAHPTFNLEGDPAHLDLPLPPFISELPRAAWVPYFATALGREGDGRALDIADPATANTRHISHEYVFWIEDLGRYIDGDLAGNEGLDALGLPAPSPGAPHARALGANPAEIALFTLFPDHRADRTDLTTKDNYLFSPPSDGELAPRQLALTHRSLPLAIDAASASAHDRPTAADLAALSSTLVFNTQEDLEPQLIPRGLGLALPGDPDTQKVPLNELLLKAQATSTTPEEKDAIVRQIASAIQTHLPDFARLRKGGIESLPKGTNDPAYLAITDQEYLLNLAANIIDYADADGIPTVDPAWVPGNLPAYRGIDAQPFVMALYNHVDFLTRAEAANYGVTIAASDKVAPFKLDSWIQLWNPHNVPISGTVQLRIIEDRTTIQFGDFPAIPSATWAPVQVSLQPNQFLTVHFEQLAAPRDGTTYNIILAQGDPATAFVPDSIMIDDNPNYNKQDAGFELLWQGKLADATRGRTLNRPHQVLVRQERQGTSNANGNPWAWFGQTLIDSFKSNDVVGTQNCDPRGTLYSAGYHYGLFDQHFYYRTAAYNASGPWGGGYIRGYQSSSLQRPQYWADPSHAVTVHCRQTPNYNTLPTNVNPPTSLSRPEDAPSYLSNRGLYLSLGELGHVFDPGAWTNTLKSDTPSSITSQPSGLSGGQALRIGQQEFARFDRPGVRASHLLDVFSLSPTRPTKGLVNINTADLEVLRALAAGIRLDADPGIQPGHLADKRYAPQAQFAGDRFAQAVLASRAQVPFPSTSALSNIALEGEPFFGNELHYPPAERATSTTNAAREELFSRIHPLTSVRSRNFRIYIGGRIVVRDPSSASPHVVLATKFRELTTFVRPSRDTDGQIQSATPEIIHSIDL
jgi:hypothetical protein